MGELLMGITAILALVLFLQERALRKRWKALAELASHENNANLSLNRKLARDNLALRVRLDDAVKNEISFNAALKRWRENENNNV